MTENTPYHYNYTALDKLLQHDYDPQEIGSQLDETMNDLVSYAGCDSDYKASHLEQRYFILRTLRNLFWELQETTKP